MKKLIAILSLTALFTACSQSGDQSIPTTQDSLSTTVVTDSCSVETDSTECCKDSLKN